MKMRTDLRCDTCCYWVKNDNSEEEGLCKRYAPSPKVHGFDWALNQMVALLARKFITSDEADVNDFDDHNERYVLWPETVDEDWCGEWTDKE